MFASSKDSYFVTDESRKRACDQRLKKHLCPAEGLNVSLLYQNALQKIQRLRRRTKSIAKMDCECKITAADTTFHSTTSKPTKGSMATSERRTTSSINGKKRKKTLFPEDTSSMESYSDTSDEEILPQ